MQQIHDLFDQKSTVYAVDVEKPWKVLLHAFWDCVDMGLANLYIVYEKIVSKSLG